MAQRPLTHRQRLENCLSGESLDRVPVALWRHFPVDDYTPDGLANAIAAFQKQFDFDLIKVTPSSSFCLQDWGSKDRWTGNTEGTHDYTNAVIKHAEDWKKLRVLDPKKGSLAKQITCLNLLTSEFSLSVPVIQTIFNPLSQAKNLVGKANLEVQLRTNPDALLEGLEIITQTTIRFIEEVGKTGIDGIFYAIQHAQFGLLSEDEYERFGKPFDLRILAAASRFWLNMGHLHGENVMFEMISDYPFQIINWHDRSTPPNLVDGLAKFKGVVCGGLERWNTMVLGNPQTVRDQALDSIRSTGGKRFILGTGCVLPIIAPYGNILSARQSVDQIELF